MKNQNILLAIVSGAIFSSYANSEEIKIYSNYSPMEFVESPKGGSHPIAGPANWFVERLNEESNIIGNTFEFTKTEGDQVGNLYKKVANGEFKMAVDIPANSGLSMGVTLSAGTPFGMRAQEFMGYLYNGGGSQFIQEQYDRHFTNIYVIPIALTGAQTAGFFKKTIPEPSEFSGSTSKAIHALCSESRVVRWPGTAANLWIDVCSDHGVEVDQIGAKTKSDVTKIDSLTFGGFVPGAMPHKLYQEDEIDGYELNLPDTDVQFFKYLAGEHNKSNYEANIKDVVPPYMYINAWHQAYTYIELIVNKKTWNTFSEQEKRHIKTVAKSSVLDNLSYRDSNQSESIEILKKNGVEIKEWPSEILKEFQKQSDKSMRKYASVQKDNTLSLLLDSLSEYKQENAIYSRF